MTEIKYFSAVHVAEYSFGLVTAIVFFNIAKKWPSLMQDWTQVEQNMKRYDMSKTHLRNFYLILGITAYIIMRKYLIHDHERFQNCKKYVCRYIASSFLYLSLAILQLLHYLCSLSLFQIRTGKMHFRC